LKISESDRKRLQPEREPRRTKLIDYVVKQRRTNGAGDKQRRMKRGDALKKRRTDFVGNGRRKKNDNVGNGRQKKNDVVEQLKRLVKRPKRRSGDVEKQRSERASRLRERLRKRRRSGSKQSAGDWRKRRKQCGKRQSEGDAQGKRKRKGNDLPLRLQPEKLPKTRAAKQNAYGN
jgi:hypothetical protein